MDIRWTENPWALALTCGFLDDYINGFWHFGRLIEITFWSNFLKTTLMLDERSNGLFRDVKGFAELVSLRLLRSSTWEMEQGEVLAAHKSWRSCRLRLMRIHGIIKPELSAHRSIFKPFLNESTQLEL